MKKHLDSERTLKTWPKYKIYLYDGPALGPSGNCDFGGSGYVGTQFRRFIEIFASAPFWMELAEVFGVPLLERDEDVVAVVGAGGGIGDPGLVSG